MKVLRQVKMNTEHFEVGDQITVKVNGYGKYTAMAQKVDGDKALFFFDHCIADCAMNENGKNEGGFYASDLCKWMNEELLKAFPKKIRKRLVPVDAQRGAMLRIPTRGEMFGQNDTSGYYEPDGNEQLPLMKDRKNRICISPDDEYCWYWLMNTRRESAAYFASVHNGGYAYCTNASYSLGVRPAFEIRNL